MVVYSAGIDHVSGALSKPSKNGQHSCEKMLLATHHEAEIAQSCAALFDSAKLINTVWDGKATLSESDLAGLRDVWKTYAIDILGLRLGEELSNDKSQISNKQQAFSGAIDLLLGIRLQAKQNKDWATSDKIRNSLTDLGFRIKDTKDGFEWSL